MTTGSTLVTLWLVARHGLTAILVFTIVACSASGIYQQDLMNAPDIYDEGGIDPFTDITPIEVEEHYGIL